MKKITTTLLTGVLFFGGTSAVQAESWVEKDGVKNQLQTKKLSTTINEEKTETKKETVKKGPYTVLTAKKLITTYDKQKVSADFLKTGSLNLPKKVKDKLTADTKYLVKDFGSIYFAEYKKQFKQNAEKSEMTIEYDIKRNENGIFSVRAKVYFENKTNKHKKFIGSINLNYHLKGKKVVANFEDNYAKGITDAKIESFLKLETEKVFGKSIGYPVMVPNAYYIERSGAVVVTYPGSMFDDKEGNVYMVRIPATYFTYNKK